MATEAQIKAFLEMVIAEGKKIGVSISHEDSHGAFLVADFDQHLADWLMEADYGRYSK